MVVPSIWPLLLRDPAFCWPDLAHVEIGAFGGSPVPISTIAALRRRMPQLRLYDAYGLTETHSPATILLDSEFRRKPGSVGRPLPCADVRVVDDDGRDVPAGEPGELWMKGPMVTSGYFGDAGRHRRRHHRRVAPHRRLRPGRRRGLRVHPRPQEGHDHAGRQQGLLGRAGVPAGQPPRHRRGGRVRGARPPGLRVGGGLRRPRRRALRRHRRRPDVGRRAHGRLRRPPPRAGGRRDPPQPHRQDRQAGPEGDHGTGTASGGRK